MFNIGDTVRMYLKIHAGVCKRETPLSKKWFLSVLFVAVFKSSFMEHDNETLENAMRKLNPDKLLSLFNVAKMQTF